MEISRKQESEADKPQLDDKDGLCQNVGTGDEPYGAVSTRKSSHQRRQQHETSAKYAHQHSAQTCDRRVGAKDLGENLADYEEFQKAFDQESCPNRPPIIFRGYGRENVRDKGSELAGSAENREGKKGRKAASQPTAPK